MVVSHFPNLYSPNGIMLINGQLAMVSCVVLDREGKELDKYKSMDRFLYYEPCFF